MNRPLTTPYFRDLAQRITALGGLFNAHLHLDRAGTLDDTLRMLNPGADETSSVLSLKRKHAVIPLVHASSCYDPEVLEARVEGYVDAMIAVGTTRADTVVDVTADRVGRLALDCLLKIKARKAGTLDFRVGAYSPMGFRDDEPRRWALVQEAAADADFIGLLPERDDTRDYPAHIGFAESCRRAITLAARLDKQIHLHVDQANHVHEAGSECIVRIVRETAAAQRPGREPLVWLVHVISPSTYDEARFAALAAAFARLGVGVICCPSAALSMRQIRPFRSPTFNSIARVLEFLAAGVHVRVGSDNICDLTSPMGTTDLMDEIFVLGNALRYYDPEIMARLAAGLPLPAGARARLQAHLNEDAEYVARVVNRCTARPAEND